jgi:hypothetical protein
MSKSIGMLNVWRGLCASAVGVAVLVVGAAAQAGHDDTSLRTLTVTVSATSGNDVTVDIAGTGISSSSLAVAKLGSQFYYDSDVVNWNNAVPPAIDWGDGITVLNQDIAFTGTNTTDTTLPTSIDFYPTFSGQFMHTYAAPGSYTIRVFGSNVYALDSSYAIASGTYSVTSPSIYYPSSSNTYPHYSSVSGLIPIGITNTTTVSLSGAGGSPAPPPPATPVPTLSTWAMVLLGMLLVGFGVAALRRV